MVYFISYYHDILIQNTLLEGIVFQFKTVLLKYYPIKLGIRSTHPSSLFCSTFRYFRNVCYHINPTKTTLQYFSP